MWRKYFETLLLYFLFWYSLLLLDRAIFLLVYYQQTSTLSGGEIISTYVHGARLDLSMVAYTCMIPFVLLVALALSGWKSLQKIFAAYTYLALMVYAVIFVADMALYGFWGFRIDSTPLYYLGNPTMAFASVSIGYVVLGIVAILLVGAVGIVIFRKIFMERLRRLGKKWVISPVLLMVISLLIVVARGGLGLASLNTGSAYFSEKPFANHAALNPMWSLGFSLTEKADRQAGFNFFSPKEADSICAPYISHQSPNIHLLKTPKPNIILIITESLTAKAFEFSGQKLKVMPGLDSLIHEGILFDHVYAAAERTDKGLAAVLAGYPSLPGTTPLKYSDLTEQLALMPQILKKAGYHTGFFYGGALEFANYRSFITQCGFQHVVSDKDFSEAELASKWGAWDHIVLQKAMDAIPDTATGFFNTILTLTSHEPFAIPEKGPFTGTDDETKFLNSLHYTDGAITRFIRDAQKHRWWDNTLVIVIADHGCAMPGASGPSKPIRFHIPMIWLGGALRSHDTLVHTLASQTDLAATVLSQLGLPAKGFNFSSNILSESYFPHALYTYSDGFGWISGKGNWQYSIPASKFSGAKIPDSANEQNAAKALMQKMSDDFRSKLYNK